MTQYSVSSRAQLDQALAKAASGDVILMAGGNYGTLKITADSNITLKSQSAVNPAVFSGITANQVHNLTFDGLKLDGSGTGIGLAVNRSDGVTVQNCEFTDFLRGLQFIDVAGLNVINNDVSRMVGDGMTFAAVRNTLIQNNDVHDQNGNPNSSFHKDLIQFWTEGTSVASQNVTIRGNNLVSGDGSTQSIFINTQAGQNMYYRDFLIEDNTVVGGHVLGINVGGAIGLTIRDNIVLHDTRTGFNKPINIPEIRVNSATDVEITGNLAHAVPSPRAGWVVSGNTIVPNGYKLGEPIVGGGTDPNPRPDDGGSHDVQGTNGNDQLTGGGGPNTLRGMDGADRLTGNGGADALMGGRGPDVFVFRSIADSTADGRDRLKAGDGAGAFEAAGPGAGDLIDLSAIDANMSQAGNQVFSSGGRGPGQILLSNEGSMTLLRANVDGDAAFEFQVLIEDGNGVGAGSYTKADFLL